MAPPVRSPSPSGASAPYLRRVLSQGGTGAPAPASSAATFPPASPASPSSGGVRTPRAKKAQLESDKKMVGSSAAAPPTIGGVAGVGRGGPGEQQLISHLDQLAVRSPIGQAGPVLPTAQFVTSPRPAADDPGADYFDPTSNGTGGGHSSEDAMDDEDEHDRESYRDPSSLPHLHPAQSDSRSSGAPRRSQRSQRRHTPRSHSTSTESSSMSGYTLPSNFGSMYTPEGYAAYPNDSDSAQVPTPSQRMRDEAIAQQIAQADEAIKQINGTASVIHAPTVPGVPSVLPAASASNMYELPRGFANFTRPTNNQASGYRTNNGHGQGGNPGHVTRQSSTSSASTRSASTSSEESDICIPSIEWVYPPAVAVPNSNYPMTKMMPPPSRSGPVPSPRRAPSAIPFGGSATTPGVGSMSNAAGAASGLGSRGNGVASNGASAVGGNGVGSGSRRESGGMVMQGNGADVGLDEAGDDDDDDQTVGHREQSPSTSSSTSGLDLLWQAARQFQVPAGTGSHIPGVSKGGNGGSAGAGGAEYHKRKAGAGAEAVAQWRTSGIPTGSSSRLPDTDEVSGRRVSAPGGGARDAEREGEQPPKKRRRSELATSTKPEPMTPPIADVRMDDGGVVMSSEGEDESADESEYQPGQVPGGASGRSAGVGKSSSRPTRGRRPRKPAVPAAPSSHGTPMISTPSGGAGPGSGGGGAAGSASTPGGGPKKSRKSDTLSPASGARKPRQDSVTSSTGATAPLGLNAAAAAALDPFSSLTTSAGGGGGSKTHPVGHGTVQCEYVNPLPPYQRCTDVFTRKYDLPRHMARHARREGELVAEGRLEDTKAVLWKAIKDKPKVECKSCGESFTRMDALKRHQAKQHH